MRIDFPYPGYQDIAPVDIPDENLIGVYQPQAAENVDEEKILRLGLANPRFRTAWGSFPSPSARGAKTPIRLSSGTKTGSMCSKCL